MFAQVPVPAAATDLSTVIALGIISILTMLAKAWIDQRARSKAATSIAAVKTVAVSTHALVNGNLGAVLTDKAIALRRVAALTQDPVDIRAAETAEQLAADHVARCAAAKAAPPETNPPKGGQRGFVGVGRLVGLVLVALGIAMAALCGCASTDLQVDQAVKLEIWPDDPCLVVATRVATHERAARITAPGDCQPSLPTGWLCARWKSMLADDEHLPKACSVTP